MSDRKPVMVLTQKHYDDMMCALGEDFDLVDVMILSDEEFEEFYQALESE